MERTSMSEQTIAARAFAAQIEWGLARELAGDAILDALGFDPHAPDTWPKFDDFTFDHYDESFEIRGVVDAAFTISPESWTKCRALGFDRAWLCYTDGSERHFWGSDGVSMKPAPCPAEASA
jgi:hypothetical protein